MMITRTFIAIGLIALASGNAAAQSFEAGQLWNCTTDQGERAFMEVHEIEDTFTHFSWGVDRGDEFHTLCNKSDELDFEEMTEFCVPQIGGISIGHAQLSALCDE